MELGSTSKLLALPHFHIKEKLVLMAYWAEIPHLSMLERTLEIDIPVHIHKVQYTQ